VKQSVANTPPAAKRVRSVATQPLIRWVGDPARPLRFGASSIRSVSPRRVRINTTKNHPQLRYNTTFRPFLCFRTMPPKGPLQSVQVFGRKVS